MTVQTKAALEKPNKQTPPKHQNQTETLPHCPPPLQSKPEAGGKAGPEVIGEGGVVPTHQLQWYFICILIKLA